MIAPDKCYPRDCLRSGRWSAGSPPRSSPAGPRPSATCLPDRRAPRPRNGVFPEGEAPCAQRGEQLRDSHPGKWFSLSCWNLLEPNKCTFSPNTVVFTAESAVRSVSFFFPAPTGDQVIQESNPFVPPLLLSTRHSSRPQTCPSPPSPDPHSTKHMWESLQSIASGSHYNAA